MATCPKDTLPKNECAEQFLAVSESDAARFEDTAGSKDAVFSDGSVSKGQNKRRWKPTNDKMYDADNKPSSS